MQLWYSMFSSLCALNPWQIIEQEARLSKPIICLYILGAAIMSYVFYRYSWARQVYAVGVEEKYCRIVKQHKDEKASVCDECCRNGASVTHCRLVCGHDALPVQNSPDSHEEQFPSCVSSICSLKVNNTEKKVPLDFLILTLKIPGAHGCKTIVLRAASSSRFVQARTRIRKQLLVFF